MYEFVFSTENWRSYLYNLESNHPTFNQCMILLSLMMAILLVYLSIVMDRNIDEYRKSKEEWRLKWLKDRNTILENMDPWNVKTWNVNSVAWHVCTVKGSRDYFDLVMGRWMGIPASDELRYPNFDNKGFMILETVMDNYYALIRNGNLQREFVLSDSVSGKLGTKVIVRLNIDKLILEDNETWSRWEWKEPDKLLFQFGRVNNFFSISFCYDEIYKTLKHLAWIKDRFDRLNNDPMQGIEMGSFVKLEWIKYSHAIMRLHWHYRKSRWNQIMPRPLSIDDMNDILVVIWDELSDCEPGKILEKHYLEHPEDSLATNGTRTGNDRMGYVSKYLGKMGDALIGTMCPFVWDSMNESLSSQSHVVKDTTIVNRSRLSGMGSVMDGEDIIDRDGFVRSDNNVYDLEVEGIT